VKALCVYGEEQARRFATQHVDTIVGQATGVREADVEAVHDMRVASRRLRATLSEFEDNFEPDGWAALREQARRVTTGLGRARELDVTLELVDEIAGDLKGKTKKAAAKLSGWLANERSAFSKEVSAVANDVDSGAFDKGLARLLEGAAPSERCYSERAARRLGRRLKRLNKYHRKWRATLVEEHLHAVRIQFKKLRYACELYEDAYGDKMRPILKSLKGTQRALGAWNDLRILRDYLQTFAEKADSRGITALVEEVDTRTLAALESATDRCESFFTETELQSLAEIFERPHLECCAAPMSESR